MLSSEHEQLLETLLELRPGKPAVVVITSSRLTAGAEILEFLSSRFGFEAADTLLGEAPLSEGAQPMRRFIHGLPFLSPSDRSDFLGALNRGRDRIETLSNQVVLWLHEDDLGEFFSVAPDLASWVDEVLRWGGEPVVRRIYSPWVHIPREVEDVAVLDAQRQGDEVLRGTNSSSVPLWIPGARGERIVPERLHAFMAEIATTDSIPQLYGGIQGDSEARAPRAREGTVEQSMRMLERTRADEVTRDSTSRAIAPDETSTSCSGRPRIGAAVSPYARSSM